ncbi:hypothetical protein HMN09_00674200 [Mycena chlorophos]|uniref:Transmembrane protein n=1 Tax=Mycena chlorophos TaxID=658473 RepID=A0A8H6SYD1_MYCCL|nr:hypothetical protein HMN09_00674200 [Mycena chlorophos]
MGYARLPFFCTVLSFILLLTQVTLSVAVPALAPVPGLATHRRHARAVARAVPEIAVRSPAGNPGDSGGFGGIFGNGGGPFGNPGGNGGGPFGNGGGNGGGIFGNGGGNGGGIFGNGGGVFGNGGHTTTTTTTQQRTTTAVPPPQTTTTTEKTTTTHTTTSTVQAKTNVALESSSSSPSHSESSSSHTDTATAGALSTPASSEAAAVASPSSVSATSSSSSSDLAKILAPILLLIPLLALTGYVVYRRRKAAREHAEALGYAPSRAVGAGAWSRLDMASRGDMASIPATMSRTHTPSSLVPSSPPTPPPQSPIPTSPSPVPIVPLPPLPPIPPEAHMPASTLTRNRSASTVHGGADGMSVFAETSPFESESPLSWQNEPALADSRPTSMEGSDWRNSDAMLAYDRESVAAFRNSQIPPPSPRS